ncbi:MAG: hypothetical protein K1V76_07150 [Candidatus Amulumruptor sp.]
MEGFRGRAAKGVVATCKQTVRSAQLVVECHPTIFRRRQLPGLMHAVAPAATPPVFPAIRFPQAAQT